MQIFSRVYIFSLKKIDERRNSHIYIKCFIKNNSGQVDTDFRMRSIRQVVEPIVLYNKSVTAFPTGAEPTVKPLVQADNSYQHTVRITSPVSGLVA